VDKLDQIRRLALFAVVCDAGGFAAAARTLGLTRSAVSRQVGVLEAELGARLLHRTTRRLAPTEAGRLLLPRCERLLAEARDGLAAVAALADAATGTLTLGAPMGLAESFVAPTLAAFARENPGLTVDLRVSDRLQDIVDGEVDVVVRAGNVDADLVGRRLGPLPMVLCAAPAYLGARGVPTLDDLERHDWLLFSPLPPTLTLGGRTIRPQGRLRTDSGSALREMTLAGGGLALLPRFFVDAQLKAGALVPILTQHDLPGGSVWALHGYGRRPPRKVRAFLDFAARRWAAR